MRLRLAKLLDKTGNHAETVDVLRQAVAEFYRPGVPLHEFAQRLVEAGLTDAARTLAADTADTNDRQQVLSGMLDGAIKADNLELGSETLRIARRLPHQGAFDPFAIQAKALAAALAKAGRYRQALATFPVESPVFGEIDLATLATRACAADPSLADEAGHLVALATLKLASGTFTVRAPAEEVRAYKTCKGADATQRLIATLPPDVADKLETGPARSTPADDPTKLAADASKASRNGDQASADRLFATAQAILDADATKRGASAETRRRFDMEAGQVAKWMVQANRPDPAMALVLKLPALERVPILFNLAEAIVQLHGDPAVFLAAIDIAFSAEPAFIEIEANEIRALRTALPLGSPAYPVIASWLEKLPPEPNEPVQRPNSGLGIAKNADKTIQPLMAAAEQAMPSIAVVQHVIAEAKQGDITRAITEAKTLTLIPREAGVFETIQVFLKALPDDTLAPYRAAAGLEELDPKQIASASAQDDLLVAVERTALTANNVKAAHDALGAIDPGSPLKDYAAMILAIGEARAGLPKEALSDIEHITGPSMRFAVLHMIVAVKPSN